MIVYDLPTRSVLHSKVTCHVLEHAISSTVLTACYLSTHFASVDIEANRDIPSYPCTSRSTRLLRSVELTNNRHAEPTQKQTLGLCQSHAQSFENP
ncbi:hypothetical protein KCU81_g401, partial [Aureobasidium melanogenum]